MVAVITTFEHLTPRSLRQPTIWEALADKLGREPTRAEAVAEVRRILDDCTVSQAMRGALPHQRKRGVSR